MALQLDYVDPENKYPGEGKLSTVSGEVAAKVFNELCVMLGGRWPDARMEQEAPLAYEFFTALFAEDKKFELKDKYLTIKWSDIQDHLSTEEAIELHGLVYKIVEGRRSIGKDDLEGIFINKCWGWCYDECLNSLKNYVEGSK